MSTVTGFSGIEEALRRECPGKLRSGEPLAPRTSIKVGGPAELWFEPDDEESLSKALRIARDGGSSVYVIGGGSNVLIPDEGLKGLVIHLAAPAFRRLEIRSGDVTAGGAVPLSLLMQFLIENDLGDCEFLMGIPAQVGGALAMNAGSATQALGQYVLNLKTTSAEFGTRILDRAEIPFRYRSSGLRDVVITEAVFRFPSVPSAGTREKLAVYSDYRRKTQDLKFPNAGCMFRNPEGSERPAGRLIEEAGLKGRRIGGAEVSRIHANFVVNVGRATRTDVLSLLELAERTVLGRFGVKLEREIKLLGS